MDISSCKTNETYRIAGYNAPLDRISRRFMELGLVVGEKIRLISRSLQKKVVLLEVRGYLLSVRSDLLEKVQVERC